jgi:uncharacterized lipoprotein YbaY
VISSDVPFKKRKSFNPDKLKDPETVQLYAKMRLENSVVFRDTIKKRTLKEKAPNVHKQLNDLKNFIECTRSTVHMDHVIEQKNNVSFGQERSAGGQLLAAT